MFTNGENHQGKNPHRMILKLPLPRIYYYHNKRLQVKESQYLIPTYSWTFTPIPNWTCSVVTISHFQCMAPSTWRNNWCTDPSTWLTNRCMNPSTWLTTNLRRMLAANFFSSLTRWRSRNSLVTKPYGIQTQQLLQEKDELGHMSPVTICLWKTFAFSSSSVTALKIILIMFRVVRI